jgi:hypothetical protein
MFYESNETDSVSTAAREKRPADSHYGRRGKSAMAKKVKILYHPNS